MATGDGILSCGCWWQCHCYKWNMPHQQNYCHTDVPSPSLTYTITHPSISQELVDKVKILEEHLHRQLDENRAVSKELEEIRRDIAKSSQREKRLDKLMHKFYIQRYKELEYTVHNLCERILLLETHNKGLRDFIAECHLKQESLRSELRTFYVERFKELEKTVHMLK